MYLFTTRRILIVSLIVGIILMLSGIGLILYKRSSTNNPSLGIQTQLNQPSMISGTFNINGAIPPGATVRLTTREFGSTLPRESVENNLSAIDEESWSLANMMSGKSYEIVAEIVVNNIVIEASAPLTVTAPASDVELTINLPLDNPTETSVISGTVRVNGYIPQGANVVIMGRALGKGIFQQVVNNLPGETRQFMSYTTALKGQTYEIYGVLYDSSKRHIGSSEVLIITAPAVNEELTINSQAIAPTPLPTTPPATISPSTSQLSPTPSPTPIALSGKITFNGIAPTDSRIVILQKVYNSQNYQVAVDNISPVDGTTWTWNSANSGIWYDVIAVLKQKQSNGTDKDIADSQKVSIAAPASGVTFTINSSVSLSAPSGPISVTCNSLSGNSWATTISLGAITGAKTYWYQVGTTNGGTEMASTVISATSGQSAQPVSITLNRGTSYYVRYAYATVANVPAGSSQFSPFSSTTQIQCN
jgi:hypothetical protein